MQLFTKFGTLIVLASQLVFAAKSHGLVNGGFESGLSGWTFNAGVAISPFTPSLPPSEGTNCIHLGINNIAGSVLSQSFPVAAGSSQLLSFDMFGLIDNNLATVIVVRVDLIGPNETLVSQTFTNTGRNTPPLVYQTYSIPFTVPAGASNLTVRFSDLTPNNGIAADPILDNVRVVATAPAGLVNGSFENYLAGWTVNSASILINPYATTLASHGTNYVALGGGNVAGSILSQNFPIAGGSNYNLSFDVLARGDSGRKGVIRAQISSGAATLLSQTFTNEAQSAVPYVYQSKSIPFTVPAGVSNVTLSFADLSPSSGVAVDPILDNVKITSTTLSPCTIAGPITNSANNHIYYLLCQNTWTASEADAIALGGHLVTINNEAEQNWVVSTFSSFGGVARSLWIGLSDHVQEGNFVWASGQTNLYRNWAAGEPNSYDANEDYVHIFAPGDFMGRAAKWNDYANITSVYPDELDKRTPLHGVVEIEPINPELPCSTLLAAANATNDLLRGELTLLNNSNATLRVQLTLLNVSNATLRARISSLESTNQVLRNQLTVANESVALLQTQLSTANNTIAGLQSQLAAAQETIAHLQSELNAARTENEQLQTQIDTVADSVTLLEDFFAEQFNNPAFVIQGDTAELQVSNLVSSIKMLNPGQQQALMNLLSGAKRKSLRSDPQPLFPSKTLR